MILGLWEIILVTLLTIIGIGLGILVYSKNPRKKTNQFFTAFTFSFLVWIVSAFLSEVPNNLKYSLILSRFTYLGVLLSAFFLYHLSFHFPREKTLKKQIKYLINGVTFLLSFINIFSNFIIKNISPTPWGFDLVFGRLYFLYLFFCIILAFFALLNFFQAFKRASKIEKLQLQYLFLGLIIFLFAFGKIVKDVLEK